MFIISEFSKNSILSRSLICISLNNPVDQLFSLDMSRFTAILTEEIKLGFEVTSENICL